jgi:modification methylase
MRDLHENILVFSKGRMDRVVRGESTITREAFMRDTLSIWDIRPESATRIGHPAPFPIELPQRLIELHTYRDEVVLDPFIGAGTTAIAARTTCRRFVGYDTNNDYLDIARQRLATLDT